MARNAPVLPLAKLKNAARAASALAYAPYSHFQVGAAIWTDRGLFTGANVENASYGLCNCAERTAIFSAVAAGARRLFCVAIYTPTPTPTMPCGACRQVIYEFGPEARVIANCAGDVAGDGDGGDSAGEIDTVIGALLPGAFGPADLGVVSPATSPTPVPLKARARAKAGTQARTKRR